MKVKDLIRNLSMMDGESEINIVKSIYYGNDRNGDPAFEDWDVLKIDSIDYPAATLILSSKVS